ncbi:hypothetical protein LguiA_021453 [Lonicera macranthoides]
MCCSVSCSCYLLLVSLCSIVLPLFSLSVSRSGLSDGVFSILRFIKKNAQKA